MNEHIADYCKEYIENENSPQFAVFLKGEWGCGKTHFINSLIEKYPDNKKQNTAVQKKDIMYLSLFGVNQTSEIDDLIFQKLHPVLSSKPFRFSTNIFLAILKNKLDVELDKKESPMDLYNFETKKVIVVDDIERSGLSPLQIFGYFSEHLYQHGIKIIFIGNENIIINNDNKHKEKYLKIKEKTIGIEFLIHPEIEVAIDAFIKELSLDDEIFIDFKNLCLEASRLLECNNMRTIRQCLYNLEILIDSIGRDTISDHINEIAKTFINLFIQKSLSIINNKNQIRDAIIGYEHHKVNYVEYKKIKKEKPIVFESIVKYIPLFNCWGEIIFDGNYSKEKLSEEYINENTVNTPEQPKKLFTMMSKYWEMNKVCFKQIVSDVNKEFEDGSYLHPGEILLFFNFMLIFSQWGLIPEKKESIEETIDQMLSNYEKKITPIDDWGAIEISYGGWGYSDELPELKELHSRLKNISYKNRCTQIKNTIDGEIQKIKANVEKFCNDIRHANGTNKYYRIPILSLIDIEAFFDVLVSLDVSYQDNIVSAFEERYSNKSEYKEYQLDKDSLEKLSELYTASLSEILYNPQELHRKDISKRLQELLVFFDK